MRIPSSGPPHAVAAAVPLSAAGRWPIFLFGTLLDRDVLQQVLGRSIGPAELVPASLAGFCRVGTRAGRYPVLVARPGAMTDGCLLRRTSRRDVARINRYESGEYRAELRPVTDARGRTRPAWLYAGLDHLQADGDPWDLTAWQRRHKAAFLAACDGWMADCAEGG